MSIQSTASRTWTLLVLLLAACAPPESEPAKPAEASAPAAAEAAPVAVQSSKSFQIGALTAMALSDGVIELPNDNQVFGVGLTPGDVAAVLSANGLATDKLHLNVQPLLVKTADRRLLFDTGAGTLFGPTTGKLASSLTEAGIDPASVSDIFISHSHGDHVGGLMNAEGKLAFPNATVHISQPEWEHMSSQQQYRSAIEVLKSKVHAFAPGAELVPGLVRAVAVRGHTPGHSAYRIGTGKDSLIYVGDSMHHYVVSVQKPEWTIAFDGDKPTATASRQALLAELAASGERVYAVHFPFPGLGRIEKRGQGFAWAAE
jgi:glyoxylase-like metal-dependent hydrolase (beta-lactamase superfamily II)